jgi:hypothetical protein
MCLLLAAIGLVEGHPVVCVANRDESFDRESDPPASRGGDPEVWCGLDRRAGGTWLGMNAAGVVVVLTNAVWREAPRGERGPSHGTEVGSGAAHRRGEQDAMRVSRGGAARAALTERTARDAAVFAGTWSSDNVPNPFSLFAADARSAWFVAWGGPGGGTHLSQFRPGLHTLTNTHDLDELPSAEVLRAADGGPVELARGIPIDEAERRLLRIAKSHAPLDGGVRGAICVHGEGRGTVSSALLAIDAAGRPARFLSADGPPCVTTFRDVLTPRR